MMSPDVDNENSFHPKILAKGVIDSFFQAPKYSKLILGTLFSPLLLFFIFLGNLTMLGCSWLFYVYENPVNSSVSSYFDSLWWCLTTVTTVGYGDIVPITFEGKIIGIIAMLLGVAFFVGSTALFISLLIAKMNNDLVNTRLLTYQEFEEVISAIKRLESKLEIKDKNS